MFWQLGSMNGSRWSEVLIVAAVGLPGRRRRLPAGPPLRPARRWASAPRPHLGLRVERLRIGSILLVALLTGVAVAFAGIISFVGLVVPHLVRMLLGPSHRTCSSPA